MNKEALRKALSEYTAADVALKQTIVDGLADVGSFVFSDFARPMVVDRLPEPLSIPSKQYSVSAIRINGEEIECQIAGRDEWYPLAFDFGVEEMCGDEVEFAGAIIQTLSAE